ncbi:PA2928 family protein [Amycolatopsis lurida]
MYQNPPQYAPAPSLFATPQRRRKLFPAPLVIFMGLFALLFFGGSYLVSPDPDIEAQPGVAFAEVDGRDVVLLPYERSGGRGMFQLMARDMFQVRLAAADPASGEVLWDTQLSDELVWEASVLAAGQRYAYVATDAGLMIVDLADGSVEAQGEEVQGLGTAFVTARGAYAHDPENNRILALTTAGTVKAIELDQTSAAAVDEETASAWGERLSAKSTSGIPPKATGSEAGLLPSSAEQVVLEDVGIGDLGSVLFRGPEDGRKLQISQTAFPGARLVIADGTAAGAATGHVLVQHQRSVNDTAGYTLSLVSLATGQVTGSLPVDSTVEGAVVGPDGTTAVATRDEFVLANGDGSLTHLDVGETDFFGSA